jgi:hypothetical protein
LPAGNPFNVMLPVATEQVVWVIAPTTGAVGVAGCTFIITLAVGNDVHPTELVTVKLYVPDAKPEIVVVVVLPVIPPGLMVQLPAGRPLNTTLPVATEHAGWVTAPTTGGGGGTGGAGITTFSEGVDMHPPVLVTV